MADSEEFGTANLPASQEELDAYLASRGGGTHSDLARQSLYVKFDPLVSATGRGASQPTTPQRQQQQQEQEQPSKLLDLQTPEYARSRARMGNCTPRSTSAGAASTTTPTTTAGSGADSGGGRAGDQSGRGWDLMSETPGRYSGGGSRSGSGSTSKSGTPSRPSHQTPERTPTGASPSHNSPSTAHRSLPQPQPQPQPHQQQQQQQQRGGEEYDDGGNANGDAGSTTPRTPVTATTSSSAPAQSQPSTVTKGASGSGSSSSSASAASAARALEETKKRLSQLSRGASPRTSFGGTGRGGITTTTTLTPAGKAVPSSRLASGTSATATPTGGRGSGGGGGGVDDENGAGGGGDNDSGVSRRDDVAVTPPSALGTQPTTAPSTVTKGPAGTGSAGALSSSATATAAADASLVQRYKEELNLAQMEIEELQEKLKNEKASNLEMNEVVLEYEKTLNQLVAEKQSATTGDAELRKKTDQLEQDLRSTETAFSDLHRKYENQKKIADNLRENEDKLKEALRQAQEAYAQSQESYKTLKQHAQDRIQAANVEIARVREENKGQLAASAAKMRRMEVEITQLKRQLEAKEADNRELTNICEDLVKQIEGSA